MGYFVTAAILMHPACCISVSSVSTILLLLHSTGVQWVEMHKLAERVELEELKNCGILHGDVEEMMKVNKVTWENDTILLL